MIAAVSALLVLAAKAAAGVPSLGFPDTSGKMVMKTDSIVIRLLETPGSNVKTVEALFIVKASPAACNTTVLGFEHYPEFMPNITRATFVERRKDRPVYQFIFKVALWTISYTNIFTCRQPSDLCYEINWEFVSGDIKKNTGSWTIMADPHTPGATVIRYKAYIDTGMLVPGWVRDRLTTKSIPAMIEWIKKRVGN
jgi:ribosome-associated toxin RatA of RatAB toxin-antitoxin module